jgi:O-antigen/teichoic acid export membrane protein
VLLGSSFQTYQLALGLGTSAVVLVRLGVLVNEERAGGAGPVSRTLLKDSRWLWIKALVGWSYLDATVLLLAVLSDNRQVALFAAAARLVGLMTQPLIALNWVFTPALAHESVLGHERFALGVRRLNEIGLGSALAGVAICVAVGRFALAGFGKEYQAAEPVLLLLALGFAVHSTVLSSVPLVVAGGERQVVLASLVGLGTLGFTITLVGPTRGALGAAFAVLVGLLLAKVLVVPLYLRYRLPLGGWKQAVATLGALGWFAAVWLSNGWVRDAWLGAGGLIGAVFTLAILHRTRLFAAAP